RAKYFVKSRSVLLAYLLDQHFPKVIKTSRDLPTDQRRGQRITFVLFHFEHARRVQAAGFQREGSNSDRGNAGEESGRMHIQRLEPRQPLRPKSKKSVPTFMKASSTRRWKSCRRRKSSAIVSTWPSSIGPPSTISARRR